MKDYMYSDYYLESGDRAICSMCDANIDFDPGNIDSLIDNITAHECEAD